MQLGPKEEDVEKPVNTSTFLVRLILGALAAAWFVLVPIYMWLKDQIVPKGQPIWEIVTLLAKESYATFSVLFKFSSN